MINLSLIFDIFRDRFHFLTGNCFSAFITPIDLFTIQKMENWIFHWHASELYSYLTSKDLACGHVSKLFSRYFTLYHLKRLLYVLQLLDNGSYRWLCKKIVRTYLAVEKRRTETVTEFRFPCS